jgi:hypothetical protein
MLIVSKFHDYYDVGMRQGMDKTVVYERKTVSIEGKFPSTFKYSPNEWRASVLAFCGKFYPFVYRVTEHKVDRIIWDVEEAVGALPKSKYRYYWDDDRIDSEAGIRKFFDRKYPELERLFHEHRTPIFGFEPAKQRRWGSRKENPYESLVLSPNLKDIKFYKVKDPISAFQDIYMFVSGVLGAPAKKAKPIDDKIMAVSKGHDGEYSFKKPPGKRGKNKWR